MKKWIKSVGAGLIGGLFGGVLCLIILDIVYNNSEVFGNVADWVSGIGAIGAILAVYWQVQKQSRDSKESYNQEQEFKYSISRPLLKMSIENLTIDVPYTIYNEFDEGVEVGKEYWLVRIENLSFKPLMAIEINYEGFDQSSSTFFIPNIDGSSDTYLMLGSKLGPTGDESNEVLNKIEKGNLSYITELGERCFAKFKKNNVFQIRIFDRKYENRDNDEFKNELDFNDKSTSVIQSYFNN